MQLQITGHALIPRIDTSLGVGSRMTNCRLRALGKCNGHLGYGAPSTLLRWKNA